MGEIEVVGSGLSISREDEQSVFRLAAELDRRWNQRDAAAFADFFVTDGGFRFYSGDWVKGKAAIVWSPACVLVQQDGQFGHELHESAGRKGKSLGNS